MNTTVTDLIGAATILGVHPGTVRRLTRKGKFIASKDWAFVVICSINSISNPFPNQNGAVLDGIHGSNIKRRSLYKYIRELMLQKGGEIVRRSLALTWPQESPSARAITRRPPLSVSGDWLTDSGGRGDKNNTHREDWQEACRRGLSEPTYNRSQVLVPPDVGSNPTASAYFAPKQEYFGATGYLCLYFISKKIPRVNRFLRKNP